MESITETIQIAGMSCMHCVAAVKKELAATEGVEVEEVTIGSARVRYNPERARKENIFEAIEEAGYEPVR